MFSVSYNYQFLFQYLNLIKQTYWNILHQLPFIVFNCLVVLCFFNYYYYLFMDLCLILLETEKFRVVVNNNLLNYHKVKYFHSFLISNKVKWYSIYFCIGRCFVCFFFKHKSIVVFMLKFKNCKLILRCF